MYIQTYINQDSVKTVQDSLKNFAANQHTLNNISFDLSKIGHNEIALTLLGYGIVFLALLMLYLIFANFTRLISASRKRKLRAVGKHMSEKDDVIISGETVAAISMALMLHFQEVHDIENTILTIKKVQSTYSPWNSKLYGLRQNPKY